MFVHKTLLIIVAAGVVAPASVSALKAPGGSIALSSKSTVMVDKSSGFGTSGEANTLLIRGGGQEPQKEQAQAGGITMTDVVKLHALSAILFAGMFFLETFGITIPLLEKVGPSAMFPGFDMANATLKWITRFLCCMWASIGWMELEFVDSPKMHDLYRKFHVPLSAVLLYTAKETECGMLYAVLIALYGTAGFVFK